MANQPPAVPETVSPSQGGTKALPVIVPPVQGGPVAIPATPRPSEPAEDEQQPEKRGRWKKYVFTVLILVLLGGMYVVAQWSLRDRVPTGTTVAGVGIGELSINDAISRLDFRLGDRLNTPVELVAGSGTVSITPSEAGLSFDGEATVDGLTGFSLDPQRLWRHMVGTTEVAPVVHIDRERLEVVTAATAAELQVTAVDGTVRFAGTEPVMTDAVDGTEVDAAGVEAALLNNWLIAEGPVTIDYVHVTPEITQAATEQAYADAQALVAGPVTVQVAGQSVALPVDLLVSSAEIVERNQRLDVTLNGEPLADAVIAGTEDIIQEPVDAYFTFPEGTPVIAGGEPGTILDEASLATRVLTASRAEDRVASVELYEADPAVTVAHLESLNITQLVSSFSTPHTNNENRTNNLRRGSQLVTGRILLPGDTFSIVEALSPISADNGFFNASVIEDGAFRPGMGGGLSQLATNMYNVAYFAGYEIIERRPHSLFLSMYPPGREATFFTGQGAFDMRFRNNTPYAAVINSWVEGGRQYAELWGTPYFRVETEATPRTNIVPAEAIPSYEPDCTPRNPGQAGFSITNTRRVFRLDTGALVDETSHTHRYNPDHGRSCPG